MPITFDRGAMGHSLLLKQRPGSQFDGRQSRHIPPTTGRGVGLPAADEDIAGVWGVDRGLRHDATEPTLQNICNFPGECSLQSGDGLELWGLASVWSSDVLFIPSGYNEEAAHMNICFAYTKIDVHRKLDMRSPPQALWSCSIHAFGGLPEWTFLHLVMCELGNQEIGDCVHVKSMHLPIHTLQDGALQRHPHPSGASCQWAFSGHGWAAIQCPWRSKKRSSPVLV